MEEAEITVLSNNSWYEKRRSRNRIYIRTGKKSDISFALQLENCISLIDGNEEYSLYVDENVSSDEQKPALFQLLRDCIDGDLLIVFNLSRIAKTRKIAKEIKDLCNCKIKIKFSDFDFLGNLQNQTYKKALRLKEKKKTYRILLSLSSNKTKLTSGTRGQPTYGWRSIGNKRVEVVEEQEVISKIRNLREMHQDYNISQMCKLIDASGIKIGKTKRCYPQTLKRIFLHNNII